MRTSSPLLERVQRLARRISHNGTDKLVFVDAKGNFDCCPAGEPRAVALQKALPPRYSLVGVFAADASVAMLAQALRGRSC